MSNDNSGKHIKEAAFVIGGFIVGYMVGNQVADGADNFTWLWMGLTGAYIGWMCSD